MKIPVIFQRGNLLRSKPLDEIVQIKGFWPAMTFQPSVVLLNRVIGELLDDYLAERVMITSRSGSSVATYS